jgi:serine/threonine protein kinase
LGAYILVTPYYKLGSFEQLMGKDWKLDELMLFFYQMAKAHLELYKNGICHLDLKPENILLESNTQYILCDLGCSRKL